VKRLGAGGVAELDEAVIMSNVTCASDGFCCRGSLLMSSSKTSLNMFDYFVLIIACSE